MYLFKKQYLLFSRWNDDNTQFAHNLTSTEVRLLKEGIKFKSIKISLVIDIMIRNKDFKRYTLVEITEKFTIKEISDFGK